MTQCQMKLHHPAKFVSRALEYVEETRRIRKREDEYLTLDQLLLKLIKRKVLLYISRELV